MSQMTTAPASKNLSAIEDDSFAAARRPRAAIYVRRSVYTEGGKSKSIKEQIAECTAVCQYMEFDVDAKRIFAEEEGKKGEWWWPESGQPGPYRPELGRLVKATQNAEIDVLVCWRSDRLYRDSGVADALLKLLRKHNVRFVASRHDYHIESATGFANAASEAVRNREFSEKLGEDIKRDLAFKAAMGQFTRSSACLGFRSAGKDTHDVIAHRDEIALVRRIFQMFVHGEDEHGPMSQNGIATKLVSEGITLPRVWKTKERAERRDKITATDVKNILTLVTYIGKIKHDGKLHDCPAFLIESEDESGSKETVIPLPLFEAAQERLARSTKWDKRRSYGERTAHLLTGICVCGNCGATMYVLDRDAPPNKSGNRIHTDYFRCTNFHGARPCRGMRRLVSEAKLEAWVFGELAPILVSEAQRMRSCQGRDADLERLATLRRQYEEARLREGARLRKMIDVLDETQFGQLALDLRAEREAIQRQIAKLEERLDGAPTFALSVEELASMDRASQRAVLQGALEWIAVCFDGVVALTRWGTYVVGALRRGDKARGENWRANFLDPARPADAPLGLSWMGDPKRFVAERRRVLGSRAARLTDGELLPGYEVLIAEVEPYISTLRVEYLEESANGGDDTAT